MRADPDADEPLVQVLVRPGREPGVDPPVERDQLLGDAAGGGDRHDHHDGRLQQEYLDVAHRSRLETGRRDEREQSRHLAQHLGGRLERVLDLAPHRGQVEGEARRPRLLALEHPLGVEAVAGLGRDPAGGGVRVGEQAELLELRELVAHRARRDGQPGALDERLRADGLAGGDVLLDQAPEEVSLALA